jgi:aldose 1-epimerase
VEFREDEFGRLDDGRRIARFTLDTASGLCAQIISYGGALVSLAVPDRAGRLADVVLGFDDLAGYVGGQGYLGALIGRYANRIAGARFALDGTLHRLVANEGGNQLHGGPSGFDRAVWRAAARETPQGPALDLDHFSPDGEDGYPGNLSVRVTYTLEADALRIDYTATTDRDTIINLTNHTYWNLAGHAGGSILDHRLEIDAERFAVVSPGQIPTGELRAVAGTPFDFRSSIAIGARIGDPDDQLRLAAGYDHSFELQGAHGALRRAARVIEPVSGRVLEVLTAEPAVQLYTGNHLDSMRGKAGTAYHRHTGFCLETQHHPDSPNRPAFPSTVLRAGAHYRSTTVYRLLAEAPLSRIG